MSSFNYQDKDWLSKETLLDQEQAWACVSLIGPELPQKHDKMQIMLRGNMSTQDEAAEHSKMLSEKHKSKFAVYTVEMGNWLRLPPTEECMNSIEAHDAELNRIIKEHLDACEAGNKNFENRKIDLQNLAGNDNYDEASKILYADKFTPPEDSTEETKSTPPEEQGPIESPWNKMENYKVGDQSFAVVSIIPDPSSKSENNEEYSACALKIHGSFPNEDSASVHAKSLQAKCSEFNIHVVDMYRWLTIPPNIQNMKRSIYPDINGKLNELLDGHSDNQAKAEEFQSSGGFTEDPMKGLPQIEDSLQSNPHPSLQEENAVSPDEGEVGEVTVEVTG